MYFGGGTSIWVMALMAMMGMFSRAKSRANCRPLGVDPALDTEHEPARQAEDLGVDSAWCAS